MLYFKCKYEKGVVTNFRKDGSFGTQETNEILEIIFSSIDYKNKTGRMIAGNVDIKIIPIKHGDTLLLIDLDEEDGDATSTTIFNKIVSDNMFASVHSRHHNGSEISIGMGPLPSQYFGFCKGLRSN